MVVFSLLITNPIMLAEFLVESDFKNKRKIGEIIYVFPWLSAYYNERKVFSLFFWHFWS